ncbi:MAG: methylthioribulose 1-phosphate dehydratase [Bradymonadaceae bacterium]
MSTSDAPSRDELARTLADHARSFDRRGWVLGTSGNLSARLGDTGRFLITVTGRHKGELEADDFVTCNLAGQTTVDDGGRPSSDVGIHRTTYRELPQADALYHVHHPDAVALTVRWETQETLAFSGYSILKVFGIDDVTASYEVPIISDEGAPRHTARTIRRHTDDGSWAFDIPAVVARRHGLYVWGETPFAARRHLEALAHLCEVRLLADRAGPRR